MAEWIFMCLLYLTEWFADLSDPRLVGKWNKWTTRDWESQVGKGVQTKWSTIGRISFVTRSRSRGSYVSKYGYSYLNLMRNLATYYCTHVSYCVMYYLRYSVYCLKKLHHREKRFMQWRRIWILASNYWDVNERSYWICGWKG